MDIPAIKKLRANLKLTQEGFARELGVSVSTVQKWESGRARPRGLSLKALEEIGRKAHLSKRH
jgi:DNA-binding transcriptional regulator YiaG